MSSRVFAPKTSVQRVKRPVERIYGLSATPPRVLRSPSPALVRPPPQLPKPGPSPCKICGSIETEEGDGNIVCKGCGLVLSNAPNYTSDITFEEGSNGRIQQQGQRVADGQTHQKAYAPRGLGGGPGHEATPAGDKAKSEATGVIRRFAMLLRIDEREVNMGRRIFEMAYNRGFVRGRTIESVAIVSLYIATRRAKDRKPLYDIMLIDLAEHASINVFDLGKMMQDMIKKLYLNPDGTMSKDDHFYLQAHGAEVLIDKFVNHLDFGSEANKIRTDATRILQRMKRDWIHHGRRPSGVCGAAVILAARMNNYRRTLREVVLVAKVTEFTVSKRLEEFKETKSSDLSVNDFRDDGILSSISDMDPPAYYRASMPPKPKGKRGRKRKIAPETAAEIEGSETDSQLDATDNGDEEAEYQPPSKRPRLDADGFAVPELPIRGSQSQSSQLDTSNTSQSPPQRRGPGRAKGSKNWVAPPPTPEELAYEEELTSSMQQALDENADLDSDPQLPTPSPTQPTESTTVQDSDVTGEAVEPESSPAQPQNPPSTLPLRVDPAECDPRKGPPGPAVNTNIGNIGTVSLDPVILESEFDSDAEVSTCLLSEEERVLKEKIWVTENAEWLRQDHAKRIRRELKDRHLREQGIDPDELRKGKKGEVKKRKDGARRSGRVGDVGYLKDDFHKEGLEERDMAGEGPSGNTEGRRPSTASMTVKAMMKQRGTYSRRINYDNLIKAYEYPVSSSSNTSPSPSPSMARDSREPSVISVSSTGTATDTDRETIGPIFAGNLPRRIRKPRTTSTARIKSTRSRNAQPNTESRSPPPTAADSSHTQAQETTTPNPDPEPSHPDPTRNRSGSAVSPEPGPNQAHTEIPSSPSSSPLSSTHTPIGASTPGSTGPASAPTRINRSMYTNLGSGTVTTPNKDYDNEDEDDDDDEEDEEDDDDDDLDDAFSGNYQERPVWQGEDEVVEE